MDVINYINTQISTAAAYIHNNIHSITTEFMRFHHQFMPCAINIIYKGTYTILTTYTYGYMNDLVRNI